MGRLRQSLLWLHWAAGLLAGCYAVLIGLTGAALVFRNEIESWEHPEIHRGKPHDGLVTADDALSFARREFPDWQVLSVNFPYPETPAWMTYLLRGNQAREAYISLEKQEFIAVVDPKAGLSGWLADLHFNLLAGRTGRLIGGWAALILLFLGFSGLILWLPRSLKAVGSQLAARFRIDPSANGAKLWWQTHHAVGIVASLFVIILAVSGPYFTWSRPYIDFASRYLGRTGEPQVPHHPKDSPLLPVSLLAEQARKALPGLPIHRIQVVTRPDQPVRVTMREGSPAEFHLVSTVFLDPVTGAVLFYNRLRERPPGDTFLSLLSALHFGVVGGWPARALWFALAFSLPVLAASGFLMWWRKG